MKLRSSRLSRANTGAALLEVLLAVALFVGAAAVVTSALNSSLSSLERQRLNTQALNLASSVLAEMQLGIRPVAPEVRKALAAPYEDWTCEIVMATGESEVSASGPMRGNPIEVILRHENPTVVHRLAQILGPVALAGSTNTAIVNP